MVLSYELAIAKLAQGRLEEGLQLALEYLNNVSPYSISQYYLAGGLHLIASAAYGRLSKLNLAR